MHATPPPLESIVDWGRGAAIAFERFVQGAEPKREASKSHVLRDSNHLPKGHGIQLVDFQR